MLLEGKKGFVGPSLRLMHAIVGQAATCGRCRAELGEAGRVCRHCRMDEVWLAWEMRLFRLDARAMAAGANVSAEDAVRQVHILS